MFPASLYPAQPFAPPLYPGAGKAAASSGGGSIPTQATPGSLGVVNLFPGPLFPGGIFPASAFSGDKYATPPPANTRPPDPAETVWTLGVGGPVVPLSAAAGYDFTVATQLLSGGVPCAVSVTAELQANVWPGGSAAPILVPDVEWLSRADGTLLLTVPGAASAVIEPGEYRLQVAVVDGGRWLAYDGTLDVTASPGSGSSRAPYCSESDLLLYYDQLPHFQNRDSDQADFLEQRANASDEIDRELVERYDPRPGFVRTRQPTYDPRFLGFDRPDPTVAPPSKADLTDYLAAGGLVPERKLREIAARKAIALILDRQEVLDPRNGYRDQAAMMRREADLLMMAYRAQIDASDPLDGVADMLVHRDVTYLPAGAAP